MNARRTTPRLGGPLAALGSAIRARVRAAVALAVLTLGLAARAQAQHLLVPMEDAQRNHLKAYGLTFFVLKNDRKTEWFLNYRGGSFLIPDTPSSAARPRSTA